MAQFIGFRYQVSGVRCQGTEVPDPDTLYETLSVYGKTKVGLTTPARHGQGAQIVLVVVLVIENYR